MCCDVESRPSAVGYMCTYCVLVPVIEGTQQGKKGYVTRWE